MLRQRLVDLFKNYDRTTTEVVSEVIELEQRYISMLRPRGIYDDIDEIITRIAEKEIAHRDGTEEQSA